NGPTQLLDRISPFPYVLQLRRLAHVCKAAIIHLQCQGMPGVPGILAKSRHGISTLLCSYWARCECDPISGFLHRNSFMVQDSLRPGAIVSGPLFPEPVEIVAVVEMGDSAKLIGKGTRTGLFHDPVLTSAQLAQLQVSPIREPFDGDPALFRLGIEAQRLALAHEYDPFFCLSISRIAPLPHQLEAVYDYFLKLPRIRFLLADDPGAGKTIMAGLLLKELKARGLVRRTLVVAPANLTFQWQRELKDKFPESFEVVRGETLRTTYGLNPWQDRDQIVTSISWVSRIEDAKESLLRSHWDLVIVDEAHKMSAYADDKKTLAYRLGEALSGMTDHY